MQELSNAALLTKLQAWRDEQARIEGVEPYRVLNHISLRELVQRRPQSLEALLEIKGIKVAKQRRYGKIILEILGRSSNMDIGRSSKESTVAKETVDGSGEPSINPRSTHIKYPSANIEPSASRPLSVSQFLDSINLELSGMAARIRGEVSSVDIRERVIYFTLKDAAAEGTLNCLIFRSQYALSGVTFTIGDEIVVEGVPEVYKPSGRFSLRAGTIEYAGEGALKKAYDALKAKLETEGLLAPERKRPLPALVHRIALITSSEGAAIGDFTMNVGHSGLRVDFYPTAVEGSRAVAEILKALRYFHGSSVTYDCLVLIRGGGSLESLQAFNNEALVRAVAALPMPVLAGIGHERDITLASLVSDVMVSTPTAAARLIAAPWEEARTRLLHCMQLLAEYASRSMIENARRLEIADASLQRHFLHLQHAVSESSQRFRESRIKLESALLAFQNTLAALAERLPQRFAHALEAEHQRIFQTERWLREFDPARLLTLGYSLVRAGGQLMRSVRTLSRGERLRIQMSDGTVESEIVDIL